MRRLDELLIAAGERGTRSGPDVLIERLEGRLRGEREQVVAPSARRIGMTTTTERPAPTGRTARPRMRWAIGLAAFAVAIAAVFVAVLTIGGGDEEVTGDAAIERVQDLASNIRDGNLAGLIAMAQPGNVNEPFAEWMIGLRAEPQFSDCRITGESINGTLISCDVTYRADSFFTELFGPGPYPFSARVDAEGLMAILGWPPPEGLTEVAGELRAFFDTEHPELVDTVFGTGYAGLAWSRDAGETLDQYLDEFLAYRS